MSHSEPSPNSDNGRASGVVQSFEVALIAGGLILVVGSLGLLINQPWLFPSLGPTAILQAEMPHSRMSRFYNTVFGHFIGLGAGFFAVFLFGAELSPPVLASGHLTADRMWASVIALTLTSLLGRLLGASHAPAGATTLLVALGAIKTVWEALSLVAGIIIIASLGTLLRRLRLPPERTPSSESGSGGPSQR